MDHAVKPRRAPQSPRTRSRMAPTSAPDEPILSPVAQAVLCALLIAVALFATFGEVCGHDFAGFDDPITLYNNPRLKPAPPETVLHSALWYWTHTEYDLYVPLTQQVWALLVLVARVDPVEPGKLWLAAGVFHATNLVLHVGSALMVFAILRRLTRREIPSAVGALFFGLHPFQVEPVAWASGLKDVMAGFFALAALWQYVQFAAAPSPAQDQGAKSRPRRHYTLAAVLLILGLLSKPNAMVMPGLALVIDRLILGRPWQKVLRCAGGLMLIALPLVVLARFVQGPNIEKQYCYPLWQHPLIAGDALAFYLGKLLLPFHFSPDYGRNPPAAFAHGWVWWTWIFPAALAVALYLCRKSRPWLTAGGLIMLLSLAPMLGLTNFDFERISTVADHYMYLPLFGAALAIAMELKHLPVRSAALSIAYGVAGAALLFLAFDANYQLQFWRDSLTLWTHAVEVAPEGYAAHSRLGTIFENTVPPDYAKTYTEYQIALKLAPTSFTLHDDMAILLVLMGRPDEAIEHARQTIEIQDHLMDRPEKGTEGWEHLVQSRCDLATALLRRHRPADAAEYYRRALELDPTCKEAQEGLAAAERAMKR